MSVQVNFKNVINIHTLRDLQQEYLFLKCRKMYSLSYKCPNNFLITALLSQCKQYKYTVENDTQNSWNRIKCSKIWF